MKRAPLTLFCLFITAFNQAFAQLPSNTSNAITSAKVQPQKQVDSATIDPRSKTVNIRATHFPVNIGMQNLANLNQKELAKLVTDNSRQPQMAIAVNSGQWSTVEDIQEIWVPTEFHGNKILKATTDKWTYSLPTENKKPGIDSTTIIPGYATKFKEKHTGSVFRVKPTVFSDGSIQLTGSMSDTWVSGLKEKFPAVTQVRNVIGKQVKTNHLQDSQREAVFSEEKKAFQTQRQKQVKYYLPFSITPEQPETFTTKQWNNPFHFSNNSINSIVNTPQTPGILVIEAEIDKLPKQQKTTPKAKKVQRIYITSKFLETTHSPALPATLSRSESKNQFRKLSQQSGTDLLSAPSILARSGNSCSIEVIQEFIFPTQYKPAELSKKNQTPNSFPVTPASPLSFTSKRLGISLIINPHLLDDGRIQLDIETITREFNGFFKHSGPIVSLENKGMTRNTPIVITENRIEMPLFKVRRSTSKVIIPNEATIVHSMIQGKEAQKVEERKGIKKKSTIEETTKYLSVYIKAQVVDAAGKAVD